MALAPQIQDKFEVGNRVLISPQITREKDWIEATVTEVQNNPFVGIVITAKTDNDVYFFEKPDMFKLI